MVQVWRQQVRPVPCSLDIPALLGTQKWLVVATEKQLLIWLGKLVFEEIHPGQERETKED